MPNLDPAYLLTNIRTLFVVGGVYELVARSVWDMHRRELAGSGYNTFEEVIYGHSDERDHRPEIDGDGDVADEVL